MSGQIQYGSARPATSRATPAIRGGGPACLHRFPDRRLSRSLRVSTSIGVVVLATVLVAAIFATPGLAMLALVGGSCVVPMLAMTVPSPEDDSGEELAVLLGRFRHAVDAIGDAPTREQMDEVLTLARTLGLREEDIIDEVARVRASMVAAALRDEIAVGRMPVVQIESSLPPGDVCHFAAPVRTGRRRTDQAGRLLLTSSWLKFSGTNDLSIAWTQVDEVERSGNDLVVSVGDRSRGCRLSFPTLEDAARCGVIAAHLSQLAQTGSLAAERTRFATMHPL